MTDFKVFKPGIYVYPFLFIIPSLLIAAAFILGWHGVKARRQASAPPVLAAK